MVTFPWRRLRAAPSVRVPAAPPQRTTCASCRRRPPRVPAVKFPRQDETNWSVACDAAARQCVLCRADLWELCSDTRMRIKQANTHFKIDQRFADCNTLNTVRVAQSACFLSGRIHFRFMKSSLPVRSGSGLGRGLHISRLDSAAHRSEGSARADPDLNTRNAQRARSCSARRTRLLAAPVFTARNLRFSQNECSDINYSRAI